MLVADAMRGCATTNTCEKTSFELGVESIKGVDSSSSRGEVEGFSQYETMGAFSSQCSLLRRCQGSVFIWLCDSPGTLKISCWCSTTTVHQSMLPPPWSVVLLSELYIYSIPSSLTQQINNILFGPLACPLLSTDRPP
jgi:hypothetical protein